MDSEVQPRAQDEADLQPDVMNDPTFNPVRGTSYRGTEEVDTCRICRGEGSPGEPLFYPCKCSGSIKFVHQDCLMEWLSHSQKKHCELCKTSFRFTKLYHPHMPHSLPTFVFIRKAFVHFIKAFLTWCRGILVVSVWLLWLPWSMRFVWWGLFWIGDGGWVRDNHLGIGGPLQSQINESGLVIPGINRTAAVTQSVTFALPDALTSLLLLPAWLLLSPSTANHSLPDNSTSDMINITFTQGFRARDGSLLSSVPYLDKLTSSLAVNQFIIDILEGQIITLAVVVAFILVFLIREWVVQQQPVIDLGAANVEAVNNPLADVNPADLANEEVIDHNEDVTSPEDIDQFAAIVNQSSREITQQTEIDTTSGLLPPTSSAVLDVANLQHTGMKPDAKFADLAYIENTLYLLASTNSRFESAFDVNDHAILDHLASEFHEHVVDVTRCLSALQQCAFQALNAEDADLLNDLALRCQRLHEGVAQHSPKLIVETVIEQIKKTAMWINDASQKVTRMKDLEHERQRLEDKQKFLKHEGKYEDRLSAINLDLSAESGLERDVSGSSNELSPRLRPAMPARSRSSLATEIHRSLADRPRSTNRSDKRRADVDVARPERSSEGSSGDWQLIPSVPGASTPVEISTIPHSGSYQMPFDELDPILNQNIDPDTIMVTQNQNEQNAETAQLHPPTAEDSTHQAADRNLEGDVHAVLAAPLPGLLERLWNWLFADIGPMEVDDEIGDDEQIVEELDDEPPFVPFADAEPIIQADNDVQDDAEGNHEELPHILEGGLNANDPEAVDDLEDLEGIMELIGMQGPLTALFQNSVFCAVLISATVTSAVWFPYLWGKIVLIFLASPLQLAVKAPWFLFTGLTNFVVDLALFLGGFGLYWADTLVHLFLMPVGWLLPQLASALAWDGFRKAMLNVADASFIRLAEMFLTSNEATTPDFYHLSLSSHAALRTITSNLNMTVEYVVYGITTLYQILARTVVQPPSIQTLCDSVIWIFHSVSLKPWNLAASLASVSSILKDEFEEHAAIDQSISSISLTDNITHWSTGDRMIAIMAGYAFFATAGALYLKAGSPLATSQRGKKIEGVVSDMLLQAGGVLKVIMIISIEMLLFPLYCGMLLDVATLPLFENASLQSRINLTLNSPWTSGFVHWFVGTCYMFHFALFVSMCRKIVRSGVLYFIRDPDDPTFHPVRDVLERSISSQLRKIGFSALVYGALVILCMGSVVWSVAYGFYDIFPIRWSSDTPVLEFPIDLLLYNTLAPLVVHLLKPSKILHTVYNWWFRKCAQALRLSSFMFGQRNEREEHRVAEGDGSVISDGRFVRAPASDQVRIPKDRNVFVEVDENNKRLDGLEDEEHNANGSQFTQVYVPPWFRLRIIVFVFWIWALTAAAGLAFTVAPVLLGRWTLGSFAQPGTKINDIYTFFVGMCAFGILSYVVASYKSTVDYLKSHVFGTSHTLATSTATLWNITMHVFRLVFAYGSLTLLLPSLLALLLEFYVIMPLHAYVTIRQSTRQHSNNDSSGSSFDAVEDHSIHFLQSWTLGLLYLRILIRMCLSRPASRPARALRGIVEHGWLKPNVALAAKCFVFPCTVLAASALVIPAPLGWMLVQILSKFGAAPDLHQVNVKRFAYPTVAATGLGVWASYVIAKAVARWKGRIRDEVYLIGERLHNFGESHPPPPPPAVMSSTVPPLQGVQG